MDSRDQLVHCVPWHEKSTSVNAGERGDSPSEHAKAWHWSVI